MKSRYIFCRLKAVSQTEHKLPRDSKGPSVICGMSERGRSRDVAVIVSHPRPKHVWNKPLTFPPLPTQICFPVQIRYDLDESARHGRGRSDQIVLRSPKLFNDFHCVVLLVVSVWFVAKGFLTSLHFSPPMGFFGERCQVFPLRVQSHTLHLVLFIPVHV